MLFLKEVAVTADVHYLVNDFLLRILRILYEFDHDMDILDISSAYEKRTGEQRSMHQFKHIIAWAVHIGIIEAMHQPYDFLQGSELEYTYRLSRVTESILQKRYPRTDGSR